MSFKECSARGKVWSQGGKICLCVQSREAAECWAAVCGCPSACPSEHHSLRLHCDTHWVHCLQFHRKAKQQIFCYDRTLAWRKENGREQLQQVWSWRQRSWKRFGILFSFIVWNNMEILVYWRIHIAAQRAQVSLTVNSSILNMCLNMK